MKPVFTRRYRRRSLPSKNEGGFLKKDSQESFFGNKEHHAFFQPSAAMSIGQGVQRKCADCEKEDKEVQREPEKKEEEKVMRMEDKKEEEKTVQKKENGGNTSASGKSVGNYISTLSGKGQPLPAAANYFFSSRMGYDFSNVRVHTGKDAAESAKGVNAKAYTTGNNVVFNEGQYNIGSGEGKKLMAHELTHVMQQNETDPQKINRKLTYPAVGAYTETEPVSTVLDNPNLALTTPLINDTPLPNGMDAAGKMLFSAFNQGFSQQRKDGKTTCKINEPDIKVSAAVSIIKKPVKAIWEGSTDGKRFADKDTACADAGIITVYVKGKGGVSAVDIYNKVEANEKEHISDLKKCSEKHFKPFIDFFNKFGTKQVADDEAKATKECTDEYNKYVGKKDSEMINAFLTELNKLIKDRDKKGGSHHFTPDVNIDGKHCFNVVIKI
jgi:hypothetical protein